METIMNYLGEAEEMKIHRLKNELDITSPYGVYKHAHPDDKIWAYIDTIAIMSGIYGNSDSWDDDDIRVVNDAIDDKEIRLLATEFYTKELQGARLELFPDDCKIAMMSMYTNSPKLSWKAVQQALINMSMNRSSAIPVDELSIVDGIFGGKTKSALDRLTVSGSEFEVNMLFAMTGEYIRLWKKNQEKYSPYLSGWYNRMKKLAQSR